MEPKKDSKLFSLKAEHPFFYFIAPLYLLIFGLIFSAFFIGYGWIVKLILLIILLIIIRLFILKTISRVVFFEDFIQVLYLSRRKKSYNYNDVSVFREQKIGFYPIVSIIGHLRDKKKFYFYCPKSKREELDRILETKGKIIRPQI